MMIAMTPAKMGRRMKKWLKRMGMPRFYKYLVGGQSCLGSTRRSLRGRLRSGHFGRPDLGHASIHLGSRHRELDALDDDTVGLGNARTDDAQARDQRTGFDRLGRDRSILADDQHDLPRL